MIHVVRLGTARLPDEGLRLGTVRRPPRGVKKTDYARLNYYDVWLPELSPSPLLFSWMMGANVTEARWKSFARRYQTEMKRPEPQRLLALLAALSQQTSRMLLRKRVALPPVAAA